MSSEDHNETTIMRGADNVMQVQPPENAKIGIVNSGGGIGDKIQFTSMPENYYYSFGKKLVDLQHLWVYDHNPYVERLGPNNGGVMDGTVGVAIDLYKNQLFFKEGDKPCIGLIKFQDEKSYVSQPDRFKQLFSISRVRLRHPRLYRFEELQGEKLGIVTVHTTGKSEGGEMPDHVIDQIAQNYKSYSIYQVGGSSDKDTPFIDRRGLGMWESAQLIASSQIFIGVNSSMMNIAQCYPRVNRKLILIENNESLKTSHFDSYKPLCQYLEDDESGVSSMWVDYNWQYYNVHDHDMGITYSYKKL